MLINCVEREQQINCNIKQKKLRALHITDRGKITNTVAKSCARSLSQKDRHSSDDHTFSTSPLFDTTLTHDGKQNAVDCV